MNDQNLNIIQKVTKFDRTRKIRATKLNTCKVEPQVA